MRLLKHSSAAQPLVFLLVQSSDHITGATGLTPTVTLSKNGGAFGAATGAVSEIGSGWYAVAGNATDTGTLGPLVLHATGAGADPTDKEFDVVAFDPQSATNLGLSNLDAAVSSRSAPGAQMDLVSAPNATAVAALQAGIGTLANQTALLNLLEADRVIDVVSDDTQYHEVLYVAGTATMLLTKKLYDVDGNKLNSTQTVVGQARQ